MNQFVAFFKAPTSKTWHKVQISARVLLTVAIKNVPGAKD